MRINATTVLAIMREELQYENRGVSMTIIHRVIASVYGFGPKTVATTWNMMVDCCVLPTGGKPEYFLRTLHFLKCYDSFDALTARYETTPKTFRKWVMLYVTAVTTVKDNVVSRHCLKKNYLLINIT